MTFRQLEYLDALAQCGSITKAAERLFVSQSALSQQIISIEKEHQIQILDRTQKPFTFTETGKTFLKAAQEILEIKRKRIFICVGTTAFISKRCPFTA